ncbi:MAG: hypothetical protein NDJ90_05340 [Oligoflexia bacterium]|nr:hypothetical protein [Oligoflexia bacterium]
MFNQKLLATLVAIVAVCLAGAPDSHAFGKRRSVAPPTENDGGKGSEQGADEASELLDKYLALNPYIVTLQKEFNAAAKPVQTDSAGVTAIGEGIQFGKRYECRVYYALTKTDAIVPSMANTWYRFQKFGNLFIDNLAYLEVGRIRTYAPNATMDNELWGQSEDKTYYEAIRVTTSGDLIIEAFTPKKVWVRTMLSFFGLDSKLTELGQELEGLALETVVAGASGYVLSYTYCPADRIE